VAAENPYEAGTDLAPMWTLGYESGYAEPEVDHAPPVPPEYTYIFQEGELAGRDERRAETSFGPPVADESNNDGSEQHLGEAVEHLTLEAAVHVGLDKMLGAAGGLAALLLAVVQIPGDVQLKPIEDTWTGDADSPGATYVAVCPEIHMVASDGVTPDGYWTGPVRQNFAEAESDMAVHGHAQAFIALCSLESGLCGPVVPAAPHD
jgi:hypothetical protein